MRMRFTRTRFTLRRLAALGLAGLSLAAWALAAPSRAQESNVPSLPAPSPPASAPEQPAVTPPIAATPAPSPASEPQSGTLTLAATFPQNKPIRSGVIWRIFDDKGDGVAPKLVTRSNAASPTIPLPPGNYIVHATYGFASASKRVVVQYSNVSERLEIDAGALKLAGAIGDIAIQPERLSFSIYVPIGANSEGKLVLDHVKAGELVRLPEGPYHVVSTYGESNAIIRADLKVEAGRVTQATLNHRAATVTLKLVNAPGGEAFAGTAFSVLTPGGDVIREAIGAFPTVTLAEGDYVVIARHEGNVYTRNFKVESGLNRDVEVPAQQ